jgi:hypothetical protein
VREAPWVGQVGRVPAGRVSRDGPGGARQTRARRQPGGGASDGSANRLREEEAKGRAPRADGRAQTAGTALGCDDGDRDGSDRCGAGCVGEARAGERRGSGRRGRAVTAELSGRRRSSAGCCTPRCTPC